MSRNDTSVGLGPYALRVRNWCLARLSVHAGLPPASDHLLGGLPASVGLVDAWQRLQRAHRSRRPWRSRRMLIGATGVSTLLLAVVAAQWLRAAPAPVWTPVTDSVRMSAEDKLWTSRDAGGAVVLSPAEMAAVVFRRADSLEARADSVLRVRGRLPNREHFAIAGAIAITRPGRGELRVAGSAAVVRFRVPSRVRALHIEQEGVDARRVSIPPSHRPRSVRARPGDSTRDSR